MSDSKKTSRRDFLRGRSAIQSIQNALETPLATPLPVPLAGSDSESPHNQSFTDNYLEHYSHNAMACEFQVLLNHRQFRGGPQFALDAFRLIDQLESKLSSYRKDSNVSTINQDATKDWTTVDSDIFQLLVRSKLLFGRTSGAFDITTGPLAEAWGFDQRAGSIPTKEAIETALQTVGTQHIQLDEVQQRIRFDLPSLQINFNSIGKGYALDEVAKMAESASINDFIVHGGQSSVVARGNCKQEKTQDKRNTHSGWTVGLSHPTLPGCRLAEIHLVNQALSTSGTARQGFFHQGRRYGHVIDPRTGWPTDHCLSSTVITSNAADADALATAFFVMSINEVEQYCMNHPEIKTILVLPGDGAGKTDLVWFNLTDEDWTQLV